MISETVGNFRIIRQLGKGGMGEVWLAEHKEIKTQVAIKVLLPHVSEDKQQVQRFFNEAVAVSKIKHAGIARIFDVGFHSRGEAYLVMELLEGEPLSSRIERSGRLPLAHLCDVGRQIASVLEATHAAGITHRDLKPDNVFLVADAELASGERVKILDFGIAKLSSGGNAMTRTGAGAMGTPTYMSPEQWKSTATVDGRADAYSLGCLLFEMACGRPPFVAESIGEICTMHLAQDPPSVRDLVPELPEAFDALVTRLLAKAPDQRPTLREVRTALATMGDEKFSVVAPTLGVDAASSQALSAARAAADSSQGLSAARAAAAPSTGPVASGKSTTLGASAFELPSEPARKRSKAPIAAGISLVAAVAAGGAFVATRPKDNAPPAAAPVTPGAGAAPNAPGAGAAPNAPGAGAAPNTPTTGSAPSSLATGAPGAPATPVTSGAPATPLAPAAAPTSHIRIRTDPADAEVRIDGALVTNPFDGAFPKSDVGHRVDVHASGHQAESRWIAFDGDHDFDFALAPNADPHTAAKPTTHGKATTKPLVPVVAKPTTTTTVTQTTPPPPPAGGAAPPPTPPTDPNAPTTYKGTKGKLITTYPPTP